MKRAERARQLNKRVAISVLCIGIFIGRVSDNVIDTVSNYMANIKIESDCKWRPCDCFKYYDSYGKFHNDNPFKSHCTVHGDGHDCY